MNNLELLQIFQCIQQLDREPSNKIVVKPVKIIDLEKLEKVH